jgi:hypothetical protein
VSAAPELGQNRLGKNFALAVIAQMDDLAAADITAIDFTGGEPTLAPAFVLPVAEAARARGIATGIVTAAHWAADARLAERFISRFDAVDHWDISTDIYHLDFVRLETVERAFRVLSAAGKHPLIRVAHHDDLTREDAELIQRVMAFADRNVAFQSIGPVGRGAELVSAEVTADESWDRGPCLSTGPLVRWDGRTAPCCAPASHEEQAHPLWIGDAFSLSLVEIVHRWRTDALLQTIRVWGFGPLVEWFRDAGLPVTHIFRSRTCDLCVAFLRDPALAALAAIRANELEHRIRLAYALLKTFGEPWLDQLLQREAQLYLRDGVWPNPHRPPLCA